MSDDKVRKMPSPEKAADAIAEGAPLSRAAKAAGVTRKTLERWLAEARGGGKPALAEAVRILDEQDAETRPWLADLVIALLEPEHVLTVAPPRWFVDQMAKTTTGWRLVTIANLLGVRLAKPLGAPLPVRDGLSRRLFEMTQAAIANRPKKED